jgi:hypothetical protein
VHSDCPLETENLPGEQVAHSPAEFAKFPEEHPQVVLPGDAYFPREQSLQKLEPMISDKVLIGHKSQAVKFVLPEYVPALQLEHVAPLLMNWPNWQEAHALAPAGEESPKVQDVQVAIDDAAEVF